MRTFLSHTQRRGLVGRAIGGRSLCNGWNGTVSNPSNILKPHVWLRSMNSNPAITMSPLSYSSSQQPPLIDRLYHYSFLHGQTASWSTHIVMLSLTVCVILTLPGWLRPDQMSLIFKGILRHYGNEALYLVRWTHGYHFYVSACTYRNC